MWDGVHVSDRGGLASLATASGDSSGDMQGETGSWAFDLE